LEDGFATGGGGSNGHAHHKLSEDASSVLLDPKRLASLTGDNTHHRRLSTPTTSVRSESPGPASSGAAGGGVNGSSGGSHSQTQPHHARTGSTDSPRGPRNPGAAPGGNRSNLGNESH
jgi:hypothetical protein